jgi:hypothetical protein
MKMIPLIVGMLFGFFKLAAQNGESNSPYVYLGRAIDSLKDRVSCFTAQVEGPSAETLPVCVAWRLKGSDSLAIGGIQFSSPLFKIGSDRRINRVGWYKSYSMVQSSSIEKQLLEDLNTVTQFLNEHCDGQVEELEDDNFFNEKVFKWKKGSYTFKLRTMMPHRKKKFSSLFLVISQGD